MQTAKHAIHKLSSARQECEASSFVPLRLFAFGTVLIVLLISAYYAWTWKSVAGFQSAIDTCHRPLCDFASFYYPMGDAIFRTGLPINGFVYSPFIAILLAVFPPLGFDVSLILWGILQAAFIILYFLFFRWLVPANLTVQLLFVALTLASFPILHNLAWGQVGIFTTVSILGALVLYERGHRAPAAALLAFGISFKFFPLIFLAPFAIRRDLRFLLLTAGAGLIFLFLVPGVLIGFDDTLRFYSALLRSYRNFGWAAGSYNSQNFAHVIVRLLKVTGPDVQNHLQHLAEAAGQNITIYLPLLRWIGYAIMALNLGLIFLVQRAQLPHANLWSFHILFLSIPFVHQTSWPVDLVYIPFAQALLAWQLLEGRTVPSAAGESSHQTAWRKQASSGMVFPILFLFTSIFISNSVFFNLYGDKYHYGYYGFIFWADLLLLATTYMELLRPHMLNIRVQNLHKLLSKSTRNEAPASR